jgi:hypothetical protein
MELNNTSISYCIEEINNNENVEINIENLLNDFNIINVNDDLICQNIINYNENYNIKELLLICEYYGFAKKLKSNKFNKKQIIEYLVNFETNFVNNDIVCKRKSLWFYINELKNDKFMKKFIFLW